MKKIIVFLVGVIVGAIACFALLYASGFVFESLGILLYESEADQQRNFNIFIAVSTLISAGVGWWFVKKAS